MGRIIHEDAITTLADGDCLVKDSATTGSKKIDWANFKNQVEILARKNVASGYAGIASDGFLEASIMRAALVPEEVADATALAALTVLSTDIGRRIARLQDTGVLYLALATGSGADKWMVYNSNPSATETNQGISERATLAEAVAGTDTTRHVTPAGVAAAIAPYASSRAPRQSLVFAGTASQPTSVTVAAGGRHTLHFIVTPKDDVARAICSTRLAGGGGTSGFTLARLATGALDFYSYAGTPSNVTTAAGALPSGQASQIDLVLNAGAVKLYVNSVLAAEATVAGLSETELALELGGDSVSGGGNTFVGSLYFVPINCALTAADIAEIYTTSTIPAKYLPAVAAGTALSLGAWENGGVTGTYTSTALDNLSLTASSASYLCTPSFTLTKGQRIRFVGDFASITGDPIVYLVVGSDSSNEVALTSSLSTEFTSPGSGAARVYIRATTAVGTNIAITSLGATLYPAPNQEGVGPQWRGVAGTPSINLPGDGISGGVTWAVPGGSSADFGETRTASGYALGRDAVVIPEGYRIARIWCSGDGTFSVGGSGADTTSVVNGFTAGADTVPATLAAYTTSTRKLYVTLGTATTLTYCVHIERI